METVDSGNGSEVQNGVVIPQHTIEDSTNKKKKAKKTLAQLPVYRDASNLKYILALLMAKSPKKMTKFFDLSLANISETCKTIGFADVSRSIEDRIWYINCALVLINEIRNDFVILRKLNLIVDKDLDNKIKSLVKSIISQLIGWRDYTSSEGVDYQETNKEFEK